MFKGFKVVGVCGVVVQEITRLLGGVVVVGVGLLGCCGVVGSLVFGWLGCG